MAGIDGQAERSNERACHAVASRHAVASCEGWLAKAGANESNILLVLRLTERILNRIR